MDDGAKFEWGLYGGAGFIGQHLAHSILQRNPGHNVDLLDIKSKDDIAWKVPLEPYLGNGRLHITQADVRDYDQLAAQAQAFDVIVNLAAVHREPGHKAEEYFETNVKGAENICRLASETGCHELIFTSSISVYGVHDHSVDESSLPQPKTPYGWSKLEAESIHIDWVKKSGGRLSIIRPGVVFGPGEQGNVTRLIKETLRLGRAIRIKPDQPKAGIYIEELIEVIHWLRRQPLAEGQHQLVNGVSDENLTFNAYGAVMSELGRVEKKPLTVSEPLLRLVTSIMKPLGWVLGPGSKYHPERLSKLTRGNDVRATALTASGYAFAWPLGRSLADWLEKGL